MFHGQVNRVAKGNFIVLWLDKLNILLNYNINNNNTAVNKVLCLSRAL